METVIRTTKWRRMRLAGHVACMVETRHAYELLVRKSEGKRPLGRIKMNLKEIG
jgi:hypothetical protein